VGDESRAVVKEASERGARLGLESLFALLEPIASVGSAAKRAQANPAEIVKALRALDAEA
jgi:hypothetical protein